MRVSSVLRLLFHNSLLLEPCSDATVSKDIEGELPSAEFAKSVIFPNLGGFCEFFMFYVSGKIS